MPITLKPKKKKKAKAGPQAQQYEHKFAPADTPEKLKPADALLRPEIGQQAEFRKKKAPKTYRYDSSLSPALDWDGQNPAREQGEAQLAVLQEELGHLRSKLASQPGWSEYQKCLGKSEQALRSLKAMSGPFLNWAGKAKRLSFDVPTLPLFVHERLSTKAILETLKGHARDKQMQMLFADPELSITDRILKAYEHKDRWVNRMILGDSLVVMNSLLHYEGLGGQVQMIYMDPPYGVKFGSNFQPFVRKRDVRHNDDEDMTREPEMVQAYRDTWEMGLHSYLTYLRDRLSLSRDLLAPSGSIFVQISDENLHTVRSLLDEVFGSEHFVSVIAFQKTTGASGDLLGTTADYLLWYAKDKGRIKYRQLFLPKLVGGEGGMGYNKVLLASGEKRALTEQEKRDPGLLPAGSKIYSLDNLTSQRPAQGQDVKYFEYDGRSFAPGKGTFKSDVKGLSRLAESSRLEPVGNTLRYVRYFDDFVVTPLIAIWSDTTIAGFAADKLYVVQTAVKVVERCLLMTTDPGDLVLDPTCGSGTTGFVAEHWGRRWITIDTSRVPLALARQRLLTATFPYYELQDSGKGPAGGFVYKRKQNTKGEEVGGIVPHVTLKNVANNELPAEEVLVDRPEVESGITRVSGPFFFEATIPTPADLDAGEAEQPGATAEEYGSFVERMIEVLRKSPVLRLEGNKTVTLKNIRPPAKTLSLSAEAMVDATAPGQTPTLQDAVQEAMEKNGKVLPLSGKPVAFVFGPENGAVSEKLVVNAAREAYAKNYTHLYVIGFSIEPTAREAIGKSESAYGIPATYAQATPDLMMGDLLKNMRSSQIFSVCGLPEIKPRKIKTNGKGGPQQYEVELIGLDTFDPITMEPQHRTGDDVPAWFLDTDYNDLSFHVSQAFFPRTGAWENLKKALKGQYEDTVWDHLAGTVSTPFEAGEHKQIAVKVIDDRGNELLVVKPLSEAR